MKTKRKFNRKIPNRKNTLKRRLRKLGYSSYWAYLKSEHWSKFKKEYFSKYKKMCVRCKATTDLNLHHRTYIRLGHERFSDVICLCKTCHRKQHRIK